MGQAFSRLSRSVACCLGTWQAFVIATLSVVLWIACGFYVGFDNTQYLFVINTGTAIVSYLMLFLIQATQNRDSAVLHAKIDELIRVTEKASNNLISLEKRPEEIPL